MCVAVQVLQCVVLYYVAINWRPGLLGVFRENSHIALLQNKTHHLASPTN